MSDLLKGIKVVSDEEAEACDYVICMPEGPSPFDDNLTGFCCKCGIKVMYRWHAPRKPPKICMKCLVDEQLQAAQSSPPS